MFQVEVNNDMQHVLIYPYWNVNYAHYQHEGKAMGF